MESCTRTANTRTGSDSPDSAWRGMNFALANSDMKVDNIDYAIGTGYGRINMPVAQMTITEISCTSGANFMCGPEVRTVMDMGGQDCKGIAKNDGVVKRLEKELGMKTAEKKWANPVYKDVSVNKPEQMTFFDT
ncbi:MAG: BadF/BadG/BcrA/BcrD ATPase family protein [Pseudomonadota bacterium]